MNDVMVCTKKDLLVFGFDSDTPDDDSKCDSDTL